MDVVGKDAPAVVKDIESENWTQLLTDVEKMYQDVLTAVSACKGTAPQTVFNDIVHAVLQEVKLPSGSDAAKCETDIDGMYPDIEQLIKDVEAGDENKILLDALKIYNAIQSSMKDCLGKSLKKIFRTYFKISDISSCVNDFADVATKAKDVYNQVHTGDINFGNLIADIQGIVADIEKAKNDCQLTGNDQSETVMRNLAAVECQSLETCFSGCSGVAPPVNCKSLNKLQCQQLKQRAMRLAGVQRVNCRRTCRKLVSKCGNEQQ